MEDFDITELKVAAVQLHELFSNLMDAGFTEDQALKLVVSIVFRGSEESGE